VKLNSIEITFCCTDAATDTAILIDNGCAAAQAPCRFLSDLFLGKGHTRIFEGLGINI
jgi:hypothetical protein